MAGSLVSFSNELASVVERASESVVAVHARPRFNSSGVHWSPGLVVTAEHTLRHDDGVFITAGKGEKIAAEVAGRDPGTDLAVLRVKDLASPPAPRADAGGYRPGHLILAVGRNQESANAGFGVIGSMGGPSQTWRGAKLDEVIRLDLSLHPVGAGGAVVDASGKLIGIATPALSRFAVFAVPNVTVERVVQALVAHGRIPQGYLGAGLQPIALPEHLTKSLELSSSAGLMTVSVEAGAPAGKAGLLIGDVLLDLAGQPVSRPETVRPLLAEAVGKTIPARVLRGGALVNLEIAVAERQRRN
jgi:S1-C subfamily serine protease